MATTKRDPMEVIQTILQGIETATNWYLIAQGRNIHPGNAQQQGGPQAAAGAAALGYMLGSIDLPDNEAYFSDLFDQLNPTRRGILTGFLNSPMMASHCVDFRYTIPLSAVVYNKRNPTNPIGDARAIHTLEALADLPDDQARLAEARARGLLEPANATPTKVMDFLISMGQYIKTNAPDWYVELERELEPLNQALDEGNKLLETAIRRKFLQITS